MPSIIRVTAPKYGARELFEQSRARQIVKLPGVVVGVEDFDLARGSVRVISAERFCKSIRPTSTEVFALSVYTFDPQQLFLPASRHLDRGDDEPAEDSDQGRDRRHGLSRAQEYFHY